jgi:hypothetical protein
MGRLEEVGRQRHAAAGGFSERFEQLLERHSRFLERYLSAQARRDTEILTLQRRFAQNGILQGGVKQLTAELYAQWTFNVPFAWLWISDPTYQGPLYVANVIDTIDTSPGVGRWILAAGQSGPVPLGGDGLTIYAPEGTVGGPVCVTVFSRPFGGAAT